MGKEIYKKLSEHLSFLGMGYPAKEELIEILHENFTPLEAEVAPTIPAKVIPFEPVSVAETALHIAIPKEKLELILSNLADGGLFFSKRMKEWEMGYYQQLNLAFPDHTECIDRVLYGMASTSPFVVLLEAAG